MSNTNIKYFQDLHLICLTYQIFVTSYLWYITHLTSYISYISCQISNIYIIPLRNLISNVKYLPDPHVSLVCVKHTSDIFDISNICNVKCLIHHISKIIHLSNLMSNIEYVRNLISNIKISSRSSCHFGGCKAQSTFTANPSRVHGLHND